MITARTLIRHTLRLVIAAMPLTLCSCAGGQMLLIPTGLAMRGAVSVSAFAAAAVWMLLLVRLTAPGPRPTRTGFVRPMARTRGRRVGALSTPA